MMLTVYITDDLHRRMEARSDINWSKTAADAFERALGNGSDSHDNHSLTTFIAGGNEWSAIPEALWEAVAELCRRELGMKP